MKKILSVVCFSVTILGLCSMVASCSGDEDETTKICRPSSVVELIKTIEERKYPPLSLKTDAVWDGGTWITDYKIQGDCLVFRSVSGQEVYLNLVEVVTFVVSDSALELYFSSLGS